MLKLTHSIRHNGKLLALVNMTRNPIGSWKMRLSAVCSENGDRLTTFSKIVYSRCDCYKTLQFAIAFMDMSMIFVFGAAGLIPKLLR
jgi:hypothetical protein